MSASVFPVSVNNVVSIGAGLFGVELGLVDGTVQWVIIPETMATVEAVTMSAIAVAILSQGTLQRLPAKGGKRFRWVPRITAPTAVNSVSGGGNVNS